MHTLQHCFTTLLERHVPKLIIRSSHATGCCPFHEDTFPSFSADIERGLWFCHACAKGGGVKAFALAVGEDWNNTHAESRIAKARRARFQAEQQARVILARRADTRDQQLCADHRATFAEVVAAGEVLALFYRRPDLATEFPDVFEQMESEYSDALLRCSLLAARLDGEVE